MNIVVSAAALQTSGALTIYKQFIKHLAENTDGNSYYIFVSGPMPRPVIDGVEYIVTDKASGLKRVWFDMLGCRLYFEKRNIKPDYVISMQNTSINTVKGCKTIIYYHQPIPFYHNRWNPFKSSERSLFFYKHFYPLFVRAFLKKDTQVVVQIPFIKRGFSKFFSHPESEIHVLFPDMTNVNTANVEPVKLDRDYCHLVYPATAFSYKNHKVLCSALKILKSAHHDFFSKLKLHLTISRSDCPEWLLSEIRPIEDSICFEGKQSFEQLLMLYKASDALLFPSTIETLGLPLVEAAAFGLQIYASDMDYAHEVLAGYEGVSFLPPYDALRWSDALADLAGGKYRSFKPFEHQTDSSWNEFFKLIK